MTLIAVLIALSIPCWGMITRSRSQQIAASLVMGSLERAQRTAISSKNDVLVVFQHPGGIACDSLRLFQRENGAILPVDGWQTLPQGIFFHLNDGLMNERPPSDLIKSFLNNTPTPLPSNSLGTVSFRRSGQIGIPLPGGNSLIISLDNSAGIKQSTIILSRGTGRATMQ